MNQTDDLTLFAGAVVKSALAGALALLGLYLAFLFLKLVHHVLTLPMRRAERARLFLDLLESTLHQKQPVEETLISLAHSRDLSMGLKFHVLTAWLETGLTLEEALGRVPGFLPPQIVAMLRAGRKMGDLTKVLPASRHLLGDAVSQTRGALNYLVVMTFVVTPLGLYVFGVLMIFVIPKYLAVAAGVGSGSDTTLLTFLAAHFSAILVIQGGLLLALWLAVFVYIGGPRVTAWFPLLEKWHYLLPWRRRRMQRDFSTVLAVLLDGGAPEPEALKLAADCSANSIFRRQAERAVDALGRGASLPDAVHLMDHAGELRWRLRNAVAAPGGFLRALHGWHESLDARAFQQEQAAAHGITTALVLWNGLFVGLITVSVFMFLVSIINEGALW